jgi:phospholipid/cholesterol/gamma-HCH transport system permease protein
MTRTSTTQATISQPSAVKLAMAGSWTAREVNTIDEQIFNLQLPANSRITIDASAIGALDTTGAWLLQRLLTRLEKVKTKFAIDGLTPQHQKLMNAVAAHAAKQPENPRPKVKPTLLNVVGQSAMASWQQLVALLAFVGESFLSLASGLRYPSRIRWRPIFFNIRTAGFDALPIVGLLSFLLGIVVAYQGAEQLRQYGANIFVADLVGLSMVREFAPLITAIIIAGRSGSAYAAQIGTMSVTEEIDAMRTIGIDPFEMLVHPKVIALVIALPLLTVFADVLGIAGGMLMAQAQLDVGYVEFLDRLSKAVSITSYAVGIAKAPVFAAIIAMVGCFQGFRTKGGADSVGRQTTRSVVQSIFLVIVADALFSVAFSILDL